MSMRPDGRTSHSSFSQRSGLWESSCSTVRSCGCMQAVIRYRMIPSMKSLDWEGALPMEGCCQEQARSSLLKDLDGTTKDHTLVRACFQQQMTMLLEDLASNNKWPYSCKMLLCATNDHALVRSCFQQQLTVLL